MPSSGSIKNGTVLDMRHSEWAENNTSHHFSMLMANVIVNISVLTSASVFSIAYFTKQNVSIRSNY